jgi:hypothetical protein
LVPLTRTGLATGVGSVFCGATVFGVLFNRRDTVKYVLPAMLEAIKGGRETANFEAFLFHSGQVATEFVTRWPSARAGVRCRRCVGAICCTRGATR